MSNLKNAININFLIVSFCSRRDLSRCFVMNPGERVDVVDDWGDVHTGLWHWHQRTNCTQIRNLKKKDFLVSRWKLKSESGIYLVKPHLHNDLCMLHKQSEKSTNIYTTRINVTWSWFSCDATRPHKAKDNTVNRLNISIGFKVIDR